MDAFHDDARRGAVRARAPGTATEPDAVRGAAAVFDRARRRVTGVPSTTNAPGSRGNCRTSPVFPAIDTSLDRTDSTVPENRLPRCATRIPTRASTIGYLIASRSRGPTGPARMPPEICRDFTTANVAIRPRVEALFVSLRGIERQHVGDAIGCQLGSALHSVGRRGVSQIGTTGMAVRVRGACYWGTCAALTAVAAERRARHSDAKRREAPPTQNERRPSTMSLRFPPIAGYGIRTIFPWVCRFSSSANASRTLSSG